MECCFVVFVFPYCQRMLWNLPLATNWLPGNQFLCVCLIHPNSINSGPGSKNSPILFGIEILAIAKTGSLRRNNFAEVGRWALPLLMQMRNSQDFGVQEAFRSFQAIPRLINCKLLFFRSSRGDMRGGKGGQNSTDAYVEHVKIYLANTHFFP